MTMPPADPNIFHITHTENLASIVAAGGIWCDARVRAGNANPTDVGYAHIKERRMRHAVTCAAGGVVGDYVPFNFCPRSVMLYVLHRGHDGYRGGQREMVHLVSRVSTARATGRPCFFTDRHAELGYAQQYVDDGDLDKVDWTVMPTDVWWGSDPELKERRQAEFLVHDLFPWSAVIGIGVIDAATAVKVGALIASATPKHGVHARPGWYY